MPWRGMLSIKQRSDPECPQAYERRAEVTIGAHSRRAGVVDARIDIRSAYGEPCPGQAGRRWTSEGRRKRATLSTPSALDL